MPQLNPQEHAVLRALGDAPADRSPTIDELAATLGTDQSKVTTAVDRFVGDGWATVEERQREELHLADGPVDVGQLPERQMLPKLEAEGGAMPMKDVSKWAKDQGLPVGEIISGGGAKGWFTNEKGTLTLTVEGRHACDHGDPAPDEAALVSLANDGQTYLDELSKMGLDAEAAKKALKGRVIAGHKIKLKHRTLRYVAITEDGRAALRDPALKVVEPKTALTHEDLAALAAGEVTMDEVVGALKPYDVTLPAETRHPHKAHPLMRILLETRRAFLRLGFEEIVSPHVESAFWDFDALFQPQDHPARDMQDTFYLANPAAARLPDDAALVDRVRATHEDGGATGSAGWGYRWSADEARRTVLRTHTTATTIRALAADPAPPRKVFAVGRVFRNETISYKHLPEFTQVDGVIVDEHASFRHLLGTLAEFYRVMGFDRVKFKPAFFPYTEPSAEVFVYFESKSTWIELGGCGVFRPEVTEPLGCTAPVLAWGLGLERLAMLRYDYKDIRELYLSEDIDVLRGTPLCR